MVNEVIQRVSVSNGVDEEDLQTTPFETPSGSGAKKVIALDDHNVNPNRSERTKIEPV